MAKHLFEQPKHSHWNIECGDSEYFHWFACEYLTRCGFFGWSECQWTDYQVSKDTKYSKILDRLVWLNTCSSSLSIATGISNVVTLSTFIGLPVSISLGAVSLVGVSVSGLTTKYQKILSTPRY